MDQSRPFKGQKLLIQSPPCLIISLLHVSLPKVRMQIISFPVCVTAGACRIRLGFVNLMIFGKGKKHKSLYGVVFSSYLFFFFYIQMFSLAPGFLASSVYIFL